MTADTKLTPMLKQYYELKRQHPGTLLFFRLGDFYEMFYDDAVTGARELEITLTARHKETNAPVPMCGVPHHAVSNYIARLIRKGFRVAICEQTEEASKDKKLVRREVVRVITPGTAIDEQLIEARESVFLAALCAQGDTYGAAFLDLSTGEFRATQISGVDAWAKIRADIDSYNPRELLFPSSLTLLIKDGFTEHYASSARMLPINKPQVENEGISNDSISTTNPQSSVVHISPSNSASPLALTPLDDWLWEQTSCATLLLEQFGARTLDGYGLSERKAAVCAAGACLRYARETQRAAAAHISDITYFEAQDFLALDAVTVRNLELVETQGGASKASRDNSLFNVIDETVTNMGARLLRSWLLRPSVKRGEIEARLAAVEELHASQIKRDRLRARLREVSDIERLIARLNMNTATPRDLLALRRSLEQVPSIRQILSESLSDANAKSSSLLQVLCESADDLPDVRELLSKAISLEPPLNLPDGGVVRENFNQELDELRVISRDAKGIIAQIENRERARSGIANLRIKFNGVFGYFIEVSKGNAARVPSDYERRQTLTTAERFTTPELKSWETRVLGAEERIVALETQIFNDVRAEVSKETKRLQLTARALQMLDALASLAETAARRRYIKPILHDGDELEIAGGRHPVIEAINDAPFVPNDLYMNNSTDRLLIITGPNMGGKSTVLRQTALICILAQMGSFVPATRAKLPILDRIWTRVGASDDLSRGRSTFMVEMSETAQILHNATPRSLVLLDEIGRGTATFDGLSIAWAVAEYLHDEGAHAAKTLFATHFHELTELAEKLHGAQNYQIKVAEREGDVIFLYRVERGRASKSYGIQVARLAGLPPKVLERAREVLRRLERYELEVFNEAEQQSGQPPAFGDQQTANGEAAEKASTQTTTANQSAQTDVQISPSVDDKILERVARRTSGRKMAMQATLFDAVNQSLLDELRGVEIENLSPEEARQLLTNLRERLA